MKLHKDGMTNKQIVEILKSKKIKRRNHNEPLDTLFLTFHPSVFSSSQLNEHE